MVARDRLSPARTVLGGACVLAALVLLLQEPVALSPWAQHVLDSALIDAGGLASARSAIDYTRRYDVCTVGAGLSGSVFAERSAVVQGKRVLVLDARRHIAGNCYDYRDPATGILMNKYGAHLFHTNDEKAWRWRCRRRRGVRRGCAGTSRCTGTPRAGSGGTTRSWGGWTGSWCPSP
jgi:hypothetical protein